MGAPTTPHLVVMGVSGTGKSTVGTTLADRLGVPFLDGDDLHPPVNREKMSAGTPLTDRDREPWLDAVGAWLAARPGGAVVACSALRRTYRDRIRAHDPAATFVHLTGSRAVVAQRLADRQGHFMPPGLLDSQLATLEPLGDDEVGATVPVEGPPEQVVAACVEALEGLTPPRRPGPRPRG